MHKLINKLFFVIALIAVLISMPLSASPLDEARRAGQVIETPAGYIKATGNASRAISELVADVNKRRRLAYEKIAKKNSIEVAQVAAESYAKRRNR